ncbi:MAG: hypothetical protein DI598_08260 [Pseudopedobacter saltans]|uniref:DUF6438 domain-containing protein n=1 Tax=Pseudopedobacter saltans TaxID=151895 RepID=A0A2W5EZ54_9SPHI|nr:MAG: hypothetical protein DI598_08260 [Pseudopedobacter saltans]
MRNQFLLLFLLIVFFGNAQTKKHSIFDSIKNTDQLNVVLKGFPKLQNIKIGDFKDVKISRDKNDNFLKLTDSFHLQPFYLADFDNNGYTDVFLSQQKEGWNARVIMVYPNDSFNIVPIYRLNFSLLFVNIGNNLSQPSLQCRRLEGFLNLNEAKNEMAKKIHFDTLIYKFGSFIEYNAHPDTSSFKQIEFSSNPTHRGSKAEMSINANKIATKFVYKFVDNQDKPIHFTSNIPSETINELEQLINYINISKLKDAYINLSAMDASRIKLHIKTTGLDKTINIYAEDGTFGLQLLQEKLYSIFSNAKWTEVTEK